VQAIVDHAAFATESLAHAGGVDSLPPYRYAATAWAMVMRSGDYTTLHEHGDAHWSSVYYADAGDADTETYPESGLLAFTDPKRSGLPVPQIDLFPSTFTIRPRTGTLVLFPGWLPHYVHSYRGTRPRVSVSCNVTLGLPG
jgi:hypothetical protein